MDAAAGTSLPKQAGGQLGTWINCGALAPFLTAPSVPTIVRLPIYSVSQRPSRRAWKLPTASQPASVLVNLNKRGGKSSLNAETDTGIHYILPFELIARGQGFACTTQRCLLPLSRLHCCVGRQTSMPSNPRSPPLPPARGYTDELPRETVTPYSSSSQPRTATHCLVSGS